MRRQPNHRGEEPAAADWVLRLRAPEADEADWLAFERWLAAEPGNRASFDLAEALWRELDARAQAIAAAIEAADRPGARAVGGRWRPAAVALFASAALLLLAAPYGLGFFAPRAVVYATAKGQRRTVRLADGTRVDLNSGSSITVRVGEGRRDVVMNDAEAAFDVTHDPSRPFVIHVGDESVRVIGTQFDVFHRGDVLAVTVRRGLVRVASESGGEAVSLTPGQQFRHRQGDPASIIDSVAADDAFAWREGRLICRDEALSSVVAELNRYFRRPIRIQGERLASLKFSGVLTIDDESSTLRRLSALLPLSATPSEGVIVLKSRESAL